MAATVHPDTRGNPAPPLDTDIRVTPRPPSRSPRRRHRPLTVLGLVALAGIVAAACSSSPKSATPPTTPATPTTASPPSTPTVPRPVITTKAVGNLGKILVNSQGQVLYTFTKNGAAVPCSASCLSVWPAVAVPAGVTTPTGSAGVGTLGTTTSNGPAQVTVGGLPLFTYAGDSGPGVANGNNVVSFGGTWKVVKAQ